MVHDAVASSSDNSDGGSGPDSSEEDDGDLNDDDSEHGAERRPNGIQQREGGRSDNDRSDDSESDSGSDSSVSVVRRRPYRQHPHHYQHRHEANHDHNSRSSSRNSSMERNRQSRGNFITIKRRKDQIPSPSSSNATPRGPVAPVGKANGLGSPGIAPNLHPSSQPSSSTLGQASDHRLLQPQRIEQSFGNYDEYNETIISSDSTIPTPAFATLVSSVNGDEGLRRRGAAASLVAALGAASLSEEGKASDGDGGSTCCSAM